MNQGTKRRFQRRGVRGSPPEVQLRGTREVPEDPCSRFRGARAPAGAKRPRTMSDAELTSGVAEDALASVRRREGRDRL
jgi:hypothetical protein